MNYSQKLNDPRWQKKRLEIMQRDQWKCTMCKDEGQTLHIHHINYSTGSEPWECGDEDVATLCRKCHREIECSIRLLRNAVVKFRSGIDSFRMSLAISAVLSSFQKWPLNEDENLVFEVLLAASKMESKRMDSIAVTGEKMTPEAYCDECDLMVANRLYR